MLLSPETFLNSPSLPATAHRPEKIPLITPPAVNTSIACCIAFLCLHLWHAIPGAPAVYVRDVDAGVGCRRLIEYAGGAAHREESERNQWAAGGISAGMGSDDRRLLLGSPRFLGDLPHELDASVDTIWILDSVWAPCSVGGAGPVLNRLRFPAAQDGGTA